MSTNPKSGRFSACLRLASVSAAAALLSSARVQAVSVLFDNLSNVDNGVSGASAFYYGGGGDTFVGGGYSLPAGTTTLNGIDVWVDNGTSATTFQYLQVNTYIWGSVNTTTALSAATPAFSNLLGEYTSYVGITGGLSPGGYYVPLETGSPGATPFFSFNTPLTLPTGTTRVGVTINVEGSTDGVTYASATGLTPLLTYGTVPSAGGEYTIVYLNTGGETNGNFIEGPYTFNRTDNAMGLRLFGTGNFGPDQWSNSAGGAWETGANWATGSAPTSTTDAAFNLSSSGYTVSINQADSLRNLYVQNDNVTVSIATLLSSLTLSGSLTVGQPATGSSTATGVLNLTNSSGFSVNVSAGSIVVGSNGGTGTLSVGSFVNLVTTGTTTVGAGSALNISGGKLLIPSLSLAGSAGAWTGKLDLGTGSLDLSSASLSTVTNQAAQGYNNGTWNASGGITSTAAAADSMHLTAVGVISNNVSGAALYSSTSMLGMFEGLSPGLNDVLVKYTYYGDANLDGQVDGTDYSLVDATYLAEHFVNGVATNPISGWFNGDFNYDGVVDGSDYTLMDNAYNMQGSSLAPDVAIGGSAGGAPGSAGYGLSGTLIDGAQTPTGKVATPGSGEIAYSDLSVAAPTGLIGSTSVPEPTSIGLLSIGAVGVLRRRRLSR